MRPTARSLRLTWPIARYASQAWMQDMLWEGLDVTEDQQAGISGAVAGRMMKLARERGPELQPVVEQVIGMMILADGPQGFTPEMAREFAQKTAPIVQGFRDWASGIPADSRPFLSSEQQRRLEKRLERLNAAISEFERRMQLWREGQFKPGEDPFDKLEVAGDVKADTDTPVTPELNNARHSADWELRGQKRMYRVMFLAGAEELLKFDDQQRARGQALLNACGKRMEAIQTAEWKQRIRRNRVLYHLQFSLGDAVPRGPWVHRLQREYEEAGRAIEELDKAFYADVLRLATPEQWALVREEVLKMVEKYGFSVADAEGFMHRLMPPPASRPEEGAGF